MSFADINLDVVRVVLMVVLIVAFLGMWAWAWSSKRKDVFHEASMLPLEEDDGEIPQDNEQRSGTHVKDTHGKDKQEKIEE